MEDGPKIVFIILIILAIAWAAKTHPVALNQPSSSSYSTSQNAQNSTYQAQQAKLQQQQVNKKLAIYQQALNDSVLKRDFSFYSGNTYATSPDQEYLTFTLNQNHQGKVLISGFEVRSTATGQGVTIPNGVDLPFAGVVNTENPVFISPGDRVVLVTGRSPTGYSFQVNKCTGYFNQFQKFTPYLPKNCPLPKNEPEALAPHNFSDACLDYLNTLPSCTMPLQNIPVAYLDSSCRAFIQEDINYKTCVQRHKDDLDFYSHEWRIYLGRSQELWKTKRETIKLYDLDKKVVGTITY